MSHYDFHQSLGVGMRDEIVVRPSDRLVRGVIRCLALAWWLGQAGEFVGARAGRIWGAALWLVPLAPMLWLLACLVVGRWVFRTSRGVFLIDRRIEKISFWRTAYPVRSITKFTVEEQHGKIKSNTSPRYRVMMAVGSDTHEIAWFRRRIDADTLLEGLQALMQERT